ncbi:MAG: hypothetical protein JNK10_14165 [Cyclobacteriaceae bacterium]|nr:hypothetical protein [Cyclobacteriaceae bacterium]
MSWNTIYIIGKTDFRKEVRRKLEHSKIPHMPGFVETHAGEDPCDLYWLDGTVGLREFKETIGGKLIWKHRLQFYSSLEAFNAIRQKQPDQGFTSREREMINDMRAAS